MAITAAITLSSATTTTPEQVVATCTVSNSGGDAVTVTDFLPRAFVSASTYRDFVTAEWTDAPGSDFADFVLLAETAGQRAGGESVVGVTYDGSTGSITVPLTGVHENGDPTLTLTFAPSWLRGEGATISATSGDITVTQSGQPQFPSVSVILGDGNTLDGSLSVPAGGTLAIKFNVLPLAPAANALEQAYDIGATVVTSGGVTTYATVATLTVSPQDI